MKKAVFLLLVVIFFSAVPGFSQIASIRFAETYPELCIWVKGLPLVMAEGAESVEIEHWADSPMEGEYILGYEEFFYSDNYLIMRNWYDAEHRREYSISYIYNDGSLMNIEIDYAGSDENTVYYFYGYEDKIEIYKVQRKSSIMKKDGPFESEPELEKILWFDENGSLTEIEGPDWKRVLYYDDGYIVRAEEARWGEVLATVYEYDQEEGLLEAIDVEREFSMTISYNTDQEVTGISLNPMFQTTEYGDLDIGLDYRGNFSWLGRTKIQWRYREQ